MTLIFIPLYLIIFQIVPPVEVGACFEVPEAGVHAGPYRLERVIHLADGAYPPTDPEVDPCPGHGEAFVGLDMSIEPFWTMKAADRWAACVSPSPPQHQGVNDASVVVVPCGDLFPEIFADGFESGGFGAWSAVKGAAP